ncbi:MAG: aminotransferase class III-fold pyridoxal phosphate-dependent enzyme [Oscillospiraceae bacterium]|jgi:putrescine aminotransferase|nr:aminotransferase class III-fold pyridoxal phosphate-dependent enzyme [Oscillospiraceae bacterium]
MASVKEKVKGFYTVDDAITMDYETTRDLQLTHLNRERTLSGGCKYFVKADGTKFTDHEGREHLDMIGAVGVASVGNNNDFIWSELEKAFQSKQYLMGAIAYHSIAAAFAHNMALVSPGGRLTKMGTATGGAEAIESVIKLVKLATRGKPERTRILSCEGAFHGKTTGAVSVGGKEKWRMYQHPLMESVDWVPYGDADALEAALARGVYSAFFLEPIQGEGGIIVPPEGYLTKVRALCTQYDTLMVADEIQAGCARTGKMWAVDHEGVVPDCLVFAKGFSGGLIPFGGFICTEALYEAAYGSVETCWHHTATYQENGLSATAGIASLEFIFENDLIEAAAEKGAYFIGRLKALQEKYPTIIREVRGRGLMIGLETYEIPDAYKEGYGDYFADPINNDLVEVYRIQVNHTLNNPAVFRFLPPLTVTVEEINYTLESFEKCIQSALAHTGQSAGV